MIVIIINYNNVCILFQLYKYIILKHDGTLFLQQYSKTSHGEIKLYGKIKNCIVFRKSNNKNQYGNVLVEIGHLNSPSLLAYFGIPSILYKFV